MLSIDPSTHLYLPFPPPQKRQSITAICSLGLDAQDALPSGSRPDGWSYWMRLRQDTGIGTVMDDARIREQSHIQRSSTKRPWEEEIFLSDTSNARYSGRSPTVDATALGNPLNLPRVDGAPVSSTSYGPASRGSVIKRSKLEGNEYNAFPRKSPVLSPRIPPRRPPPPSPISELDVSHFQQFINPIIQILHTIIIRILRSLNRLSHHKKLPEMDIHNHQNIPIYVAGARN